MTTDNRLLAPEKDPMGSAIYDFHVKGKAGRLQVFSSMFDEDEIPVDYLFRPYAEMSGIEQKALQLAQGNILDVGAGSGCHSLTLQAQQKNVEAIDISALAVEVMKKRGVKNARQLNFFQVNLPKQYDTILMLMNGSGIIGKIKNMETFFMKIKQLLSPTGMVLMDSSDLKYIFENEDGSFDIDLNSNYYGEVDFRMQYKDCEGEEFDWLYIDYATLSYYAELWGFKTELVVKGKHYDYLAKITFA